MKIPVEKSYEVISDDFGVTLAIRPMLPFMPDDFAISGMKLFLRGEGKQIPLQLVPDDMAKLRDAEEIELIEFPMKGSEPVREVILMRN